MRIRDRLSFSNVGVVLLGFVVLGGTAFALGRNSVGSKEIERNAVRSAELAKNAVRSGEVKNGALRGEDFAAGELPAGPPGPVVETLPAGATQRGIWLLQDDDVPVMAAVETEVSFPFPLASAPSAHFVGNGGASPSECPGSAQQPTAAAGHLCVYQSSVDVSAVQENVFDPTTDTASGAGKASRFGFSVRASASASPIRTSGTWAVTAP